VSEGAAPASAASTLTLVALWLAPAKVTITFSACGST
jgi:hypothetical protein